MPGRPIKPWPREETVMKNQRTTTETGEEPRRPPRSVRLPGFLIEEKIGLGDALKRITYAMGIKSCGSCEERAAALNRLMTFHR